jgi:predicted Zn finger-like uncharacterized protein
MKIQCPNPECKKVYQVDDSKIPEIGTFVKCKCETKFFVNKDSRESEEETKIKEESWKDSEKCPKCSHNRNSNDLECPYCGIYYRIYEENLKKKKIQEEPKPEEELKAEEAPKIRASKIQEEPNLKAKKEPDNERIMKFWNVFLFITLLFCILFVIYFFSFVVKTEKSEQIRLINSFFDSQSKGESGSAFFCNRIFAVRLFAVRSWKILDPKSDSCFTVRVESSNKGGSPIVVLWQVCLDKRDKNAGISAENYCVMLLFDKIGGI